MVIQNVPSTVLCNRRSTLIQMILSLLLLLASLLQQHGSEAESSHISKFQHPSLKEQNGKCKLYVSYKVFTTFFHWLVNLMYKYLSSLYILQFTHCLHPGFKRTRFTTHILLTFKRQWMRALIWFKQHYPGKEVEITFTFQVYPCVFKRENPLKFHVPRERFSLWS